MRILQEVESIGLDFIPEKENPVVLFESFSKLFNSIISIQTELVKKVDPLISVQFYLLDIHQGSIWSRIIKNS
jgi:hypothetical protein